MMKDQCISVTDLRTKTKECLEDLEGEPKYVFVNNHPVAVLLDVDEYERMFLRPELIELQHREITPALRAAAHAAKKSKKTDLINL